MIKNLLGTPAIWMEVLITLILPSGAQTWLPQEGKEMVVTITGPSGAGKGFLKKKILLSNPGIKEMSWVTTRASRQDGSDGRDRLFVSDDEFDQLESTGRMLLSQSLYGHRYGLMSDEGIFRSDDLFLTELHIDNLKKLLGMGVPLLPLAILPITIGFLRKRLEGYRKTESQEEIEMRLVCAKREIAEITLYRGVFHHVSVVSEKNEISEIESALWLVNESLKGVARC